MLIIAAIVACFVVLIIFAFRWMKRRRKIEQRHEDMETFYKMRQASQSKKQEIEQKRLQEKRLKMLYQEK